MRDEVIKEIHETKRQLMRMRFAFWKLMVEAESNGDKQLTTLAKRNQELMHSTVMEFGSRADMIIPKL